MTGLPYRGVVKSMRAHILEKVSESASDLLLTPTIMNCMRATAADFFSSGKHVARLCICRAKTMVKDDG